MTSENDSPCLVCPHRDTEGNSCSLLCLRLAAFNSGKDWEEEPLPYIAKQKKKKVVKMETTKAEDRQQCEMPGCDKLVVIRGLCQEHYDSWRNDTIEHPRLGVFKKSGVSAIKGICLIDGCDEPAKARGLCSPHYQAWRKGYIEHPAGYRFTLSQEHHKSKIKTPAIKKPQPGTKATQPKKENPIKSTSRSYPFPDLVTLDFSEYPEIKKVIFGYVDEFKLPAKHIIFSMIASAIAGKNRESNK